MVDGYLKNRRHTLANERTITQVDRIIYEPGTVIPVEKDNHVVQYVQARISSRNIGETVDACI